LQNLGVQGTAELYQVDGSGMPADHCMVAGLGFMLQRHDRKMGF
jgi:hypothetical protein